ESALHERIKQVERRLLVEVVGRIARDGYTFEGPNRRRVRLGHE
ncbi:phosphoribosylglycinamide formyltransferase, partial [Streptomyces albus]